MLAQQSFELVSGALGIALSAGGLAYAGVMDEALHHYNLSHLFARISDNDQPRQRKFEELTRRDGEFIQSAGIGRAILFALHFTSWMIALEADVEGFGVQTVLLAGLASVISMVVFGVVLPALLIRGRYESVVLRLLPSFAWISLPVRPIALLAGFSRRVGARMEGVGGASSAEDSFQEELAESLEEGEREGVLDESKREMIHNVVELGQIPASKAMIPRTEMIVADVNKGLDAALKLSAEHGHARIPVYEGTRDKIVGILFLRDLIPTWNVPADKRVTDLRKLIRPVREWPESKPLDQLLKEMRSQHVSIGILVDEHGGTAGLITLEDILEEIVGDIRDEFDREEQRKHQGSIEVLDNGDAEADGDVDLDEINSTLELSLPERPDYNSVGGLILHELGHMPEQNEHIEIGNWRLTVIDSDGRRIKRVRIERLKQPSDSTAGI